MSDILSTSAVWPNYSAQNIATASKKDTQTMGKDQFLKILITQLANQDPMQPLEDKEFIAQMAQFTSVEQLMNISTQLTAMSQSLGNVSGLIGKEVSWYEESTLGSSTYSKVVSGTVDSIIMRNGAQFAKVGNTELLLEQIIKINNPIPIADDPSEVGADLL